MSQSASPVAPDSARLSPSQKLPRAVAWALWATLTGFCALQLWRPLYFLNDDNLSGFYPVAVEAARRLWSGQTPFLVPQLFGGYDLLRDPAGLCLWNPFWLLLSPLALSSWRVAFVDCYAALLLLLGAFAMAHLLVRVREKYRPELTDARIAFLSFSYVFSIWMIVTTPNWITFLANQAALPVVFLGIFHPRRRAGIALVACAVLLSVLCGHLSSFILCLLFVGVWLGVAGICGHDERGESWKRVFAGAALAGVLAFPLLVPALQGFFATTRSGGGATTGAAVAGSKQAFDALFAMPFPVLVASYFCGMFAAFVGKFGLLFLPDGISSAVVLAPAAYWIFHSVGARRKLGSTEWACVATVAFVALCLVRPPWLSSVFAHVPLLRSTRMPFREVFALLFFVHLFIALRPVALSRIGVVATTSVGILFFVVSLAPFRPPAFTPMPLDRRLVLSGEADKYWAEVRKIVPAQTRSVPVIASDFYVPDRVDVPWSLMNGYNYAALSGLNSQSGYVIRGMGGERLHGITPLKPIGVFLEGDIPALRRADPKLSFFVLRSRHPVRIEWWHGAEKTPLPVPLLPRVKQNRWDLEPQ